MILDIDKFVNIWLKSNFQVIFFKDTHITDVGPDHVEAI